MECSIYPDLPKGLKLNDICQIEGIPEKPASSQLYTITVIDNYDLSSSVSFYLEVKEGSPEISLDNQIFTKGELIDKVLVQNEGAKIKECSISPVLPKGLVFDNTECEISGTPENRSEETEYTITAIGYSGLSDIIKFFIQIEEPHPRLIVDDLLFRLNKAAVPVVVNNSGGDIVRCEIIPALPTGLNLNESTCEISGTPVVVTALSQFTINAYNIDNILGQASFLIQVDKSPEITSVIPPADKVYLGDEKLEFTINFDEIVSVVGGNPYFELDIGGKVLQVSYSSGSGSNSLVFSSSNIGNGYNDFDGIELDSEMLNIQYLMDNVGPSDSIDFPNIDLSNVLVSTPWLKQIGKNSEPTNGAAKFGDRCSGVVVDEYGFSYCAGYTTGSLGELNAHGNSDGFIMKLDPAGNLVWLKQLGSISVPPGGSASASEVCYAITLDKNRNVYCSGRAFGQLSETHGGNDDAFVMKMDTNGNLVWVTHFGGTTIPGGGSTANNESCIDVFVDTNDNVYCAGSTDGNFSEVNAGGRDAFVLKLNSFGVLEWATQLGASTFVNAGYNTGDDYCYGVTADSSGNVYCAGYTTDNVGETNGGLEDAFMMKLDTNGNLIWVTQFGSTTGSGSATGYDRCLDIALDSSNNIYCSGFTTGAMGEGNGGSQDVMLIKLNNSGVFQWTTQLGDTTNAIGIRNLGEDSCTSIAIDKDDFIYCGGETKGAMGENFSGGSGNDIFVSKFDNLGNLQDIKQLGDTTTALNGQNTATESLTGLSIDQWGNVFGSGMTRGRLGETNGYLDGGHDDDAFIIKFDKNFNISY